jgi:hypothetical protein
VKSEQGSTLITVLLMVVVFSVIGVSLIGLNVSNAKQGSTTQNNIQAINLAEMGTTQLKSNVIKSLELNATKDIESLKTIITTTVNSLVNVPFKVDSSDPKSPSFKIESATVSKGDEGPYEFLTIDFKSVGTAQNLKSKFITGNIKLKRGKGFPSAPPGATIFDVKEEYKHNDSTYNTVYYQAGLSMASNTDITINVDLYANGTITQQSNTDLWVKGDAYVQTLDLKENSTGNGNLAIMCVDDTLYVYSSNPEIQNLEVETNFSTCQNVITTKPKNGIFAKKVVYLSINPEQWKQQNTTVENIQYK